MKTINQYIRKTIITLNIVSMFFINNSLASSDNIENLLSYQNMIIHGQGAQKLNSEYSDKVIKRVNKFINKNENKSLLKNSKGAELLENHQKLVNYNTLKNTLENCISDDQDQLMLKQRLIDSAGKSFDLPVPCRRDISKYTEVDEFVNSLLRPTEKLMKASFEESLSKNAIKTTLNTLLKIQYKYDKSFMRNGEISERELHSLTKKVCSKSNICKKNGFEEELKSFLKENAKNISKNEKKQSKQEILNELNSKVRTINSGLSEISFKAKERWYWSDYAEMNDPEMKSKFQSYIGTYLKEASTGHGALLLTDTYKDNSGSLKAYNDDSDNIFQKGKEFKFKKHKRVTRGFINKSVNEVKTKINEQIQSLNNLNKSREKGEQSLEKKVSGRRAIMIERNRKKGFNRNRSEAIEEMIMRNPVTAGQTLLQHPQYSSIACRAIKKVNKDKKDDESIHKAAVLIGAIGGGLLIATGVGAVAGGWLLTGSLSAGVAAGTVGGTVLAATTTSALVLGGAESAYFSNKAYTNYSNAQSIDRAILSETGDNTSISEQRDEVIAFKDARFNAALALGFTAVDLGAMKGLSTLAKNAKNSAITLTNSQKRNLKHIYSEISHPKTLSVMKEAMEKMGKNSSKEMDQFLGLLSTSNKKWQKELLKQLKDGEMSSSKLKRLAKEVLKAQKKCIK
jgi:hypothetical protein